MPAVTPFAQTLAGHGISLVRGRAATLQVNVGRLCNQACRHCHLDAGPGRTEVMEAETMTAVAAFARRGGFSSIDVTGGAAELHPRIAEFLADLAPLAPRLILRSNLTALAGREALVEHCAGLGAAIVASLPSTNPAQAEGQRGPGVFAGSLAGLRLLNGRGYGVPGTGLDLDLVSNPAGAFLPPEQCALERRFRRELRERHDVVFTRLYAFANVPLGRFARWLHGTGSYEAYLARLAERFNPAAAAGVMCRTLVSVAWDGTLHDCDFNQAAGFPLGAGSATVFDSDRSPAPGSPIACGEHCYACTAGTGFT